MSVRIRHDVTSFTEVRRALAAMPEFIDDRVNELLVAGTGITLSYDDPNNRLTISGTGGGGGSQNLFERIEGNTGFCVAETTTDTLQILGGVGCSTVATDVSNNDILTVNCDIATAGTSAGLATLGVASFDSADFTVTAGFVQLTGTPTLDGVECIVWDANRARLCWETDFLYDHLVLAIGSGSELEGGYLNIIEKSDYGDEPPSGYPLAEDGPRIRMYSQHVSNDTWLEFYAGLGGVSHINWFSDFFDEPQGNQLRFNSAHFADPLKRCIFLSHVHVGFDGFQKELRWSDNTSESGGGKWIILAPPNVDLSGGGVDLRWILPATQGISGQFLRQAAAGQLEWAAAGGGTQNLFETIEGNTGSCIAETTTDTLSILGGVGCSTTATDTAGDDVLTIDCDLATTAAVGVASFNSAHFSVSSGAVSILSPFKFIQVTGDSGTAAAELVNDSLKIEGGVGCVTVATDTAGADVLTINCDLATTTTVGVASFSSAHFAVSGAGAVTLAFPNKFETIAVSGQSPVVADLIQDTLTLVAGTNMTITTNATLDTITFASSGGGGGVTGTGTDLHIVRWDGTSAIQDSNWTLQDSGDVSIGGTGTRTINYATSGEKLVLSTTGGGELEILAGLVDIGGGTYTQASAAGDLGVNADLEVNGYSFLDDGIITTTTTANAIIDAQKTNFALNGGAGKFGIFASVRANVVGSQTLFGLDFGGGITVTSGGAQAQTGIVRGARFNVSAIESGAGLTVADLRGLEVAVVANGDLALTSGTGLQIGLQSINFAVSTTMQGIHVVAPTLTAFSSIGTIYGLRIADFTHADITNEYEIMLEGTAGIFFRDGNQHIESPIADTLEFTVRNVLQWTLTDNQLRFNNHATNKDTALDWTTDGTLNFQASATNGVAPITEVQLTTDTFTFTNNNFKMKWDTNDEMEFQVNSGDVATVFIEGVRFPADNGCYFQGTTTSFIRADSNNAVDLGATVHIDFNLGSPSPTTEVAQMLVTGLQMNLDTFVAFRSTSHKIHSSGVNFLDFTVPGASGVFQFVVGSTVEATIGANRMRFNNFTGDSDDTFIDWTNPGVIDFMKDVTNTPTSMMQIGTRKIVLSHPTSLGGQINWATTQEILFGADGPTSGSFKLIHDGALSNEFRFLNGSFATNIGWLSEGRITFGVAEVSAAAPIEQLRLEKDIITFNNATSIDFATADILTFNAKGNFSSEGCRIRYVSLDVADPPTNANLDSAFGSEATVENGFVGILHDSVGGKVYLCGVAAQAAGAGWHRIQMTAT